MQNVSPTSTIRFAISEIGQSRFGLALASDRSVKAGVIEPMRSTPRAFTLIELLCVMAVISLMAAVVVPAFTKIQGGTDVTTAAYNIAGTLQEARAYAMGNNTYVWVGLYEESADASTATTQVPPYTQAGRVVMAAVASNDGTRVDEITGSITSGNVTPISKVRTLQGIHLTQNIPAPSGSGADPLGLANRPDPGTGSSKGLNSDTSNQTSCTFKVGSYTFYKAVRFGPNGEAVVNGTGKFNPITEIGLVPTHGSLADTQSANRVAVQLTGIGGNVTIYRP